MKSNSSERLKELMAYYGINQTDLCKKTGIPKSAISMYISGQRTPRQDRISDIAEAYGINEAWLMGYDVEMKKEFSCKIDTENTELSSFDIEYIKKYTNLSELNKKRVNTYIDSLIALQQLEDNVNEAVAAHERTDIDKNAADIKDDLSVFDDGNWE